MIFLIPLAMGLASASCYLALYKDSDQSLRRSLLTAAISLFLFIGISTEVLGAFNFINGPAITIAWAVFNAGLGGMWWKLRRVHGTGLRAILSGWSFQIRAFCSKLGFFPFIMLSVLLSITLLIAVAATPNNLDSLSYHLSRLGYWIQQGNVGHYASHIERSISFSPFSEYVHLHTFLLAGSERYFQLLQWCCLLGILMWVSLLVDIFSPSRAAMLLALFFAATLPIAVLESMTTQNDLVVAFFIMATAFFTFDYQRNTKALDLILIAACCALGMMTKGTFAFYTLPFGVYLFFVMAGSNRLRKPLAALVCGTLLAVLVLNVPFWYRTYKVFDSPLGTISNGNQTEFHGPAGYISSVSKHVFLHLGFISPGNRYNVFLENQLDNLHHAMGITTDTHGTGMAFKMNKLNFNEDFAHNFFAIWLILFSLPLLFFAKLSKTARWYCGLSFLSFLVFCFFIGYQIYGSRLHIPFFMLVSPAIGLTYGTLLAPRPASLLTVFLWLSALPFALLSSSHPLLSTRWFFNEIFPPVNTALDLNIRIDAGNLNLKQPSALFTTPGRSLWGDRWPEMQAFQARVDALNPQKIGFIFSEASLDYAYQCILRKPGRVFAHVMVRNPSKSLESPAFQPDVIVSEIDEGPDFHYNGRTYRLEWADKGKRVYVPER